MNNSQDYAFPVMTITGGLTKREYYAALCLQGIVSRNANSEFIEARCILAVQYADELMKELNREEK